MVLKTATPVGPTNKGVRHDVGDKTGKTVSESEDAAFVTKTPQTLSEALKLQLYDTSEERRYKTSTDSTVSSAS